MVSKLLVASLLTLAKASSYGNHTATPFPANVSSSALPQVSTVTVTVYKPLESCACEGPSTPALPISSPSAVTYAPAPTCTDFYIGVRYAYKAHHKKPNAYLSFSGDDATLVSSDDASVFSFSGEHLMYDGSYVGKPKSGTAVLSKHKSMAKKPQSWKKLSNSTIECLDKDFIYGKGKAIFCAADDGTVFAEYTSEPKFQCKEIYLSAVEACPSTPVGSGSSTGSTPAGGAAYPISTPSGAEGGSYPGSESTPAEGGSGSYPTGSPAESGGSGSGSSPTPSEGGSYHTSPGSGSGGNGGESSPANGGSYPTAPAGSGSESGGSYATTPAGSGSEGGGSYPTGGSSPSKPSGSESGGSYPTGGSSPSGSEGSGSYPTGGSSPSGSEGSGSSPTGGSSPSGSEGSGSYPTGGSSPSGSEGGGSYPTGGSPPSGSESGSSYPTGGPSMPSGTEGGASYPTGGPSSHKPTGSESGGSYPTGGPSPTGPSGSQGGSYPTGTPPSGSSSPGPTDTYTQGPSYTKPTGGSYTVNPPAPTCSDGADPSGGCSEESYPTAAPYKRNVGAMRGAARRGGVLAAPR